MASKNKVAKLKNSYCLPGMLKKQSIRTQVEKNSFLYFS